MKRSVNDAASALVGLAQSPEQMLASRSAVRQRTHAGVQAVPQVAGRMSVDSVRTLPASPNQSLDGEHFSPTSSYEVGVTRCSRSGGPTANVWAMPPRPRPTPLAQPPPPADAVLLTSAAVLLASCGLEHALNASRSTLDGPPSSNASSSACEDDGGATTERASADTLACLAPAADGDTLGASVWHILRAECAHVRALDRPDFVRLCQILDLPLELGIKWQSRILRLQERMRQQAERMPQPPHDNHHGAVPSGECAASALAAFVEALASEERAPSRAAVRRFGRQTVWCTVALLRRVLREASFQAGERSLTSAQAEARLASLAVAAIGGKEV